VYDNTAPAETLLAYPTNAPTHYTVAASSTDCDKTTAAPTPVADGQYDLTVVGPNRFLRHFIGDLAATGKTAQVRAAYYEGAFDARPRLVLTLINEGSHAVTFTVAPNHYASTPAKTFHVPPRGRATYEANPLATSHGWYDVSVTVSGDDSWSRRYVGHLEDGNDSITG
jgi:phospholipase C